MTIKLHDLAVLDGRRPSPFCWRTKYALAHKELPFETVPVGFKEIPTACGGGHKTVPILDDGGTIVGDSWAIAAYLDKTYPERRKIIATPTELGLYRFMEAWLFTSVFSILFPMYAKDIHDHTFPPDRAYFRETREKWLGRTLEQAAEGREGRLGEARAAWEPIRALTRKQPFLTGTEPGYADYMAAGVLFWIATVGTLPLLKADDPVYLWFERVCDLYGGLGRTTKLNGIAA